MTRFCVLALATSVCLTLSAGALVAGGDVKPVMMTADQLKWVPNPDAEGVQMAVVKGDPAKGAYSAFHKFEPGFSAPLHTHSATNRVVVLSGTMVTAGEDGKEMRFSSGSYYTQPKGWKHTTKCLEGAECLIYLDADAKWDLEMVTAK